MNSTYLNPLEVIWFEYFNFGLTIKSLGDSPLLSSLFSPDVKPEEKLEVQLLNRPCSAEELNYIKKLVADYRQC